MIATILGYSLHLWGRHIGAGVEEQVKEWGANFDYDMKFEKVEA